MEWVLSMRADWLTPIMKFFTFLGDEEFFLLFLPLAYWLWRKEIMGRAGMILLFTFLLNAMIKGFFQVPRPDSIEHLVHADDWSFPSGHSQGAMVLWGWLAWEFKNVRGYLLAGILVGLIGFSRIYLGVHYPVDVLGGFAIGLVTLSVYAWLLKQRPAGWIALGPTRQSMVIFVLLMGLFMMQRDLSEVSIKGGAAFIGFLTGYLHERKYLSCGLKPGMSLLLSRLVLGLVGILLIWMGLKQIFVSMGYTTDMAMFIRYALLGAWISYGAPYLFCRFGWNLEQMD
ncbi:MAG: phosphatase PAP2 family protein [Candidatus Marinimicrobia bacterium]|nr:phosphatase PAP2 family protein [Candidatus Neomarinimicrobiota bacterium]MCF7850883.1 phosphatase PAP2 family protein [Candidatus Neomarinimicrobiota bacterium]MCF7904164.1 phosphatase PAP2 family protein [Candidatus Neomarinimicrobiota bacterium]